ncbi:MAG: glycosyltransferase family 2 protein [Anaerolineales bacterium]|nr:glycosyltransferase family 2 protein [Anaerolineales bacterium]
MSSLHWPRLSIITPSFNQAQFLEATLRSVLDQGYPNLEYIVIDGGSTDGSVEIIRRYADRLAYWVSEKDNGQSDAINKGLACASGEIVAWLNSDDTYLPGAFEAQVGYLCAHPEVDVVYGDCVYTDAGGAALYTALGRPFSLVDLLKFTIPRQPTVFLRRAAIERGGGLDHTFQYAMDAEYWLRLHVTGVRFAYNPKTIATYRLHGSSKTVAGVRQMHLECERLIERYAPEAERPKLLADARLQTAMRLAEQGQWRESWRYVVSAGVLRPRLLAYAAVALERFTGLPVYRAPLAWWMRRKQRG